MLPASLFERLVEGGAVEGGPDGDDVRLTRPARDAIEEHREALSSLDDAEVAARVADRGGAVADALSGASGPNRDVAAEFLALCEFGLDDEDVASLLTVLDHFRSDPPPDDGVPDAFVPVHGDRLEALAPVFPRAIVYVWREECEPCEAVRADLDAVLPEPPTDVVLLSVFGPDWARLLREAYDVVGGPTVLFLRRGRPDARLVGPVATQSLENDVRRFRE